MADHVRNKNQNNWIETLLKTLLLILLKILCTLCVHVLVVVFSAWKRNDGLFTRVVEKKQQYKQGNGQILCNKS